MIDLDTLPRHQLLALFPGEVAQDALTRREQEGLDLCDLGKAEVASLFPGEIARDQIAGRAA